MNIHLILKEGDEDLIYLRNHLPPKSFGKFVNDVINAERIGGHVFFGLDYDPFGKESGYLDLRLAIKGEDNIDYVILLPSRKRTLIIKELIRKHIKLEQDYVIEMRELEHEEQRLNEEFERRMQDARRRYQQNEFS